jgi:O-6-methylguanine DNA methyltransferase
MMLSVATIQVAADRWIGLAMDGGDGRLVACTTPMRSNESAKAEVLQTLRRFDWPLEQASFQATDIVLPVAQRLWELFQGRGSSFKLEEISLANWSKARVKISAELLRVPKGRVISYGTLAQMAGSSPRGVGRVMATNPVPLAVPCHRVIHADGRLGMFGSTTAGTKVKAAILVAEGVRVNEEETVDPSNIIG